ncbi:hypothetical protein HN873_070934, partial [Arachis hypogaea]
SASTFGSPLPSPRHSLEFGVSNPSPLPCHLSSLPSSVSRQFVTLSLWVSHLVSLSCVRFVGTSEAISAPSGAGGGRLINQLPHNSFHLLRHFTNGKELVKYAVTRFATSFLSLERLYKEKGNMRSMFTSDKW